MGIRTSSKFFSVRRGEFRGAADWIANVVRGFVIVFLPVVCCQIGVVSAQEPRNPAPATSSSADHPISTTMPGLADIYKVSPDDLLSVYVVDVPEYSRDYRVSSDGTIRLPLLNDPIMAAGETPAALGQEITKMLSDSRLLHNPHVLVEVKESRSHAIAITGSIRTPQNYQLVGRTTLLNLISQAGGVTDDASNTAIVKRGAIGQRTAAVQAGGENESAGSSSASVSVDLRRLMGGDPAENIDLYPGDSVVVQPAGIVYVVGAVNRAGGYVLNAQHENMSVLKAVSLAEDMKPTAASNKAVIIRKKVGSPNDREEIPVDVKKVFANREPDQLLLAGDVLFIPDSNAKKVLYRAGAAAAEAATVLSYGVVLYK